MSIPKIIHQTAPKDINKWHPVWKFCQDSWKTYFPKEEYTYMFWDDDDIDNFIKMQFPEYYKLFCDFGKDIILKVDFVRYAILYKYGGIYADMDFFCNKNFYDKLIDNICIVGSPAHNEIVQNSLMASPPNDDRWLTVLDNCKQFFYSYKTKFPNNKIEGGDVIDISGPRLLSRTLDMNSIHILPKELFNPYNSQFNSNDIYTKHYGTGKWGPNSGIRDFTDMRKQDDKLNIFYINNNENLKLTHVQEGYLIINVGKSNTNEKYMYINFPLHHSSKLMLCKNNYNDTFSTQIINNNILMIKRTDEEGGWGEEHNFYITGNNFIDIDKNTKHKIVSKNIDTTIIKIKIGKSDTCEKNIKLSVPICRNTHVEILQIINYNLYFKINDTNDTLYVKRLDTNEGWNDELWVRVHT